jgi:hypothetical protein
MANVNKKVRKTDRLQLLKMAKDLAREALKQMGLVDPCIQTSVDCWITSNVTSVTVACEIGFVGSYGTRNIVVILLEPQNDCIDHLS